MNKSKTSSARDDKDRLSDDENPLEKSELSRPPQIAQEEALNASEVRYRRLFQTA